MYSISQVGKLAAVVKPVAQKHFYASSIPSSSSMLHFSYRLVDLQKEIEKRTFYLGKYRKTEEAQHLLDLIGMSRDEGDLLYPFAQAAMGDVYDQLNASSLHIPKTYKWVTPSAPTEAPAIPTPVPLQAGDIVLNTDVAADGQSITIYGSATDRGQITSSGVQIFSNSVFRLCFNINLSYTTRYSIIGTTTNIIPTHTISVDVPAENIRPTGASTWIIVPFEFKPKLEPQSNITTAEIIHAVTSIDADLASVHLKFVEPTKLASGDIINYSGVIYEMLEDTDTNNLDLDKHALQVDPEETLVEGIHYYLSVPNFLNITSVEPLDNAIKEALVNRMIWKWLILSYPAEAATYDTLYQDNLKSIAFRCNIFNKHWQNIPRIL